MADQRAPGGLAATTSGCSATVGCGEAASVVVGPIARAPNSGGGFCSCDGELAVTGAAVAAGGSHAEGDVRVARVRDPAGNLLGLWQFAAG